MLLLPSGLFFCDHQYVVSAMENVFLDDFEEATVDEFAPLGNVSFKIDTNISYSGKQSVKVTGRTLSWSGISLDLSDKVISGNKYKIKAYVYHSSGSTETFHIVHKTTDTQTAYSAIANTTVPTETWTEISGSVVMPYNLNESLVYIESENPTMDVYVDLFSIELEEENVLLPSETRSQDITISEPVILPQNNVPSYTPHLLFYSDFDDGEKSGWSPMDAAHLSIDHDNYAVGSASLKVTSRQAGWDGAMQKLDNIILADKTYYFCGYIYNDSDAFEEINVVLSWKNLNGQTTYRMISNLNAPSKKWTFFEGEITTGSDVESPMLYFDIKDPEVSYYIDSISIYGDSVVTSNNTVVQSTEPQKDEYFYGFEETLDEFTSRGDNRTIRTDEYAHNGQYSAYVSERVAYWSGIQKSLDFIDYEISNTYSAYVMYNGEESASEYIFELCLQYDYDGDTVYQKLKAKNIKKGKWTKISGEHIIPYGSQNITLFIQTEQVYDREENPNDTMSFYADDIEIKKTSIVKKQKILNAVIFSVSVLLIAIVLFVVIRKIVRKGMNNKKIIMGASLDAMTKAYNRNSYEQKIAELEKQSSQNKNLYIAVCDLNYLKHINDTYGHEKGDEAIVRCGELLLRSVGKKGTVYRVGGDEFVCMSDCSFEEKLKHELQVESSQDRGYIFSVAVGFADNENDKTLSITGIFKRADIAMYENKQFVKSQDNIDF